MYKRKVGERIDYACFESWPSVDVALDTVDRQEIECKPILKENESTTHDTEAVGMGPV